MKLCIRCQTLKYPSQFRIDRKSKDGLNCCCKKCTKEMNDPHYYKNRNKEKDIKTIDKKIMNRNTCNILKYHKNIMDEDDEHLHTQFIIDVIQHKI